MKSTLFWLAALSVAMSYAGRFILLFERYIENDISIEKGKKEMLNIKQRLTSIPAGVVVLPCKSCPSSSSLSSSAVSWRLGAFGATPDCK